MAKSKQYSKTLFRRFFTNLRIIFGIPAKLRIFLYQWRHILSKLFLTLLRGFCHFFEDKNRHYYANSQTREKCLLFFGLRNLTFIQSYIPLSWILKKVKIWPTLTYSSLQIEEESPFNLSPCTGRQTLYTHCTVQWDSKWNSVYNMVALCGKKSGTPCTVQ